jgi:hypothetical protein
MEVKPEVKSLLISQLKLDAAADCREGEDEETIERYAEAMGRGEVLPEVVAFDDGEVIRLADGKKRVLAAQRIGKRDIRVKVYPGGEREAILCAAKANITHGVASSQADKRRAVEAVLRVASDWTDREIGRQCGVDHKTVASARKRLSGEIPQSGTDLPTGPLSPEESAKFKEYEGKLSETIAQVGGSAARIRDDGLYRGDYESFDAWCQGRFGDQVESLRAFLAAHDHVSRGTATDSR